LSERLSKLQVRLDALAAAFTGQASIQVKELVSGETIAFSDNTDMPAASTIKIPVMVEVFNQIAQGKLHRNDQVALQNSDRDYGFGLLAHAKTGRRYSISFLLTAMITVSDNTATNMLMRTVGLDNIDKTMVSLGLTHTKVPDYIHTDASTGDVRMLRSSAEDMSQLLALMFEGKLIDSFSSKVMLDILSQQKHNGLIPNPLPRGLRIAHKTGTLDDTLNDVAIVFVKDHPYVLAIMTTGESHRDQLQFIRTVSSAVYDEESNHGAVAVVAKVENVRSVVHSREHRHKRRYISKRPSSGDAGPA
jgi:beta-lactamase class A